MEISYIFSLKYNSACILKCVVFFDTFTYIFPHIFPFIFCQSVCNEHDGITAGLRWWGSSEGKVYTHEVLQLEGVETGTNRWPVTTELGHGFNVDKFKSCHIRSGSTLTRGMGRYPSLCLCLSASLTSPVASVATVVWQLVSNTCTCLSLLCFCKSTSSCCRKGRPPMGDFHSYNKEGRAVNK